jgi:hypothetical protein
MRSLGGSKRHKAEIILGFGNGRNLTKAVVRIVPVMSSVRFQQIVSTTYARG